MNLNLGIDGSEPLGHDFDLWLADGIDEGVELAIGVSQTEIIQVDQGELPNSRTGESFCDPTANASNTDNSDVGGVKGFQSGGAIETGDARKTSEKGFGHGTKRRMSGREYKMAEEVGFEPTVPCGTPVFKTGAFDHSATPPVILRRGGDNEETFREEQEKVAYFGKKLLSCEKSGVGLREMLARVALVRDLAVKPEENEFCELAKRGNVVPVYAQLAADFETPLSAYLKIRDGRWGFLLESAESTDASGRWSLVGTSPRGVFRSDGTHCSVAWNGKESETLEGDPLAELEKVMARYQVVEHGDAPPFFGGAVGYLGYDAVRTFEPSIETTPEDDLGLPESLFMIAGELLIFDHKLRRLLVVANAFLDEFESPADAWVDARVRVAALEQMLQRPLQVPALNGLVDFDTPVTSSNVTRERYEDNVRRAQEYIGAGDAFQVVPSQRFETEFEGGATDLYRALRHVNPSPYLFILELDGFSLVGSSPEVHVRAIKGRIDIRPIAGTRKRGKNEEEDDALAADLLADQKECAEHLMLVDLARNDVGRISEHGSVSVDDFMMVERYSHVMHIVSNVSGRLDESHSSYDVLRSTFPAGTVSGAPKIRATQIINELETTKRGAYSGAVGYFGWDGSHDSCIALRTVLLKDGKAYVQAGAGVVADSVPASEFEETANKAAGMVRAIGLAKTLLNSEPSF